MTVEKNEKLMRIVDALSRELFHMESSKEKDMKIDNIGFLLELQSLQSQDLLK